jgi:hypothetical protein
MRMAVSAALVQVSDESLIRIDGATPATVHTLPGHGCSGVGACVACRPGSTAGANRVR